MPEPETKTDAKIVTVTLTPSLDRTMLVRYLAPGYLNRALAPTRLDPAGGGVGISRALRALDAPTLAIILLGDSATAFAYRALVEAEGLPAVFASVPGSTRSNVIVLDVGARTETQLMEEGSEMDAAAVEAVTRLLREHVRPGDRVIYAGVLPPGLDAGTYAALVDAAQEAGARVLLDSVGAALAPALKAGPDLVVMDQHEAEAFLNAPVRSREDLAYAAHRLREAGAESALILSGECTDLLLETPDGAWQAALSPGEESGTHSGVEEAIIAALIGARARGRSWAEALCLAAASGSYALRQVGSAFGAWDDVEALAESLEAQPVEG